MKISKEEVLHIAELSRINFNENEVGQLREHLGNMVEHFKKLDSVDVSGVAPTAHILELHNVMREDIATPPTERELLLRNAPESDGECYILPRVLE